MLYDGELCVREQVRCTPLSETVESGSSPGYTFTSVEAAPRDVPALLDPPEGVRSQWLAEALAKHEFVLLLFYRGLW